MWCGIIPLERPPERIANCPIKAHVCFPCAGMPRNNLRTIVDFRGPNIRLDTLNKKNSNFGQTMVEK